MAAPFEGNLGWPDAFVKQLNQVFQLVFIRCPGPLSASRGLRTLLLLAGGLSLL
jgi:hypothetical protein